MALSDRVAVFRQGCMPCFLDPRSATAAEVAAAALPIKTRAPEGIERQQEPLNADALASFIRRLGDRLLSRIRQSALLLIILGHMGLLQARTGDYLALDLL